MSTRASPRSSICRRAHSSGGRAYCFGGGLYIDPVFPDYQVQALVAPGGDFDAAFLADAEIPPPSMIDYYGMLTPPDGRQIHTGDTVVFGFRIQAFVTRAYVVPISGVHGSGPQARGIWAADGRPALTGPTPPTAEGRSA